MQPKTLIGDKTMRAKFCWKAVTYDQDSRTYVGFYSIDGSTITVTHEDDIDGNHSKSAQLVPGGLGELRMATMLLGEVIRELEVGVPA